MKVKLLPLLFFAMFTCIYPQNEFWQKVSHVDAGNSVSMAVDSIGFIYNATMDQGLFRSTDNGQTWKKLEPGLDGIPITSVKVTPDGSILIKPHYYHGPLISKDHGNTWREINDKSNLDNGRLNYGASAITASSKYLLFGTQKGLYKSSDAGESWKADNRFLDRRIVGIENIQGIIFCFSFWDESQMKVIFSTSTDGGDSWTESEITEFHIGYYYFSSAKFTFNKSLGKVFCAAAFAPQFDGPADGRATFSSDDSGKTWKAVQPVIDANGEQINALVTDPQGNLIAASSNKGILKSTDWGLTWQGSNNGINNLKIGSITSDSMGNFYAGTSSSVFFSGDLGNSWKEVTKGLNMALNGFVSDDNGNIYLSSTFRILRSKDEGSSWYPLMDGVPSGAFSMLRQTKNYVFVQSTYYGYKLNQGLNKWEKTNEVVDHPQVSPNGNLYSLYNYNNSIYTSANLYISKDNGATWSRIAGAAFPNDKGTFTVDPKGILYLSSYRGINLPFALLKSTDGGTRWDTTKYNELALTKIKSNSSGYLFVMAGENKMVLSKDGGNSWININSNLPQVKISDFYIDSKNHVFILTDIGQIFCSYDNGDSWKEITNNLEGKGIAYIAFSPNSDVYAANLSGEVYKTTEASLNMYVTVEKKKDMPDGYSLSQNYPNPFNPKTTISYAIPQAGNVNISLFDALGNKVAELVNEYKSEGIFKVDFDGKNYTSGAYYYRIQSRNYTETKKLMLLK